MDEVILSSFTHSGIKEYLLEKGCGDIVDTKKLSEVLERISCRTLRNFTNCGELKTISIRPPFVYTLDDVADFLLVHPKYIAVEKCDYWTLTNETCTMIKKIINHSWKGLLKYMDFDDIVSEVQVRLLHTKKTNCSVSTAIYSILGKIYQNEKNKIHPVHLDAIKSTTEIL